MLVTDKTFFQDYGLPTVRTSPSRSAGSTPDRWLSRKLYLTGRGDRSYFDVRDDLLLRLLRSRRAEANSRSSIRCIDYNYTFDQPILGGELGYQRQPDQPEPRQRRLRSDHARPRSTAASALPTQRRSRASRLPTNCLLRGVPGNYTRLSARSQLEAHDHRSFGQIFTPFVSVRADARDRRRRQSSPACRTSSPPATHRGRAVMPTVGLEYRYPFISVQSWGTQTIEPIAQVIVRPNETDIGKLPNEDAQSLIFDDTNLFRVDKFSGWDRVEGGGRANVGVQYTAQFNQRRLRQRRCSANPISCSARTRSRSATLTNTGLDSGSTPTRSDYVARVSYQPNQHLHASLALPLRRETISTCSRLEDRRPRQFRPLEPSAAVRQLRRPAGARLPDAPRRHPRPRHGQARRRTGSCSAAARYDLDAQQVHQTQYRPRLHRRLLHLGPELHTRLPLQWQPIRNRSYRHAADQPAHARRNSVSQRVDARTYRLFARMFRAMQAATGAGTSIRGMSADERR